MEINRSGGARGARRVAKSTLPLERWETTISSAGRIVIPPGLRDLFPLHQSRAIILALWEPGKVKLFPYSVWEKAEPQLRQLAQGQATAKERARMTRYIYALAFDGEIDSANRITLSKEVKSLSGLLPGQKVLLSRSGAGLKIAALT